MKQGRDFNELVAVVERGADHREDVVARLNACRLSSSKGGSVWTIGDLGEFEPTPVFHNDVATTLKIPASYYLDMKQNFPALLDANVNAWLKATPDDEHRMLRLYDAGFNGGTRGTARAIRSTSFLPLDDRDLLKTLQPVLEGKGVEVQSCEMTDRRTFIKVTTQKLKKDIAVGDTVQAGITIINSEVGAGNVVVAPFLYRLICTNGMTSPVADGNALKRIHRGSALLTNGQPYKPVVEPLDRRAAQREIWRQVGDAIGQTLSSGNFEQLLERINAANKVSVKSDSEKLFERLAKQYGLTDAEKGAALTNYETDNERTVWGLANALTKTANHLDSYERASQLETIGGEIIGNERQWSRLAEMN